MLRVRNRVPFRFHHFVRGPSGLGYWMEERLLRGRGPPQRTDEDGWDDEVGEPRTEDRYLPDEQARSSVA